MPLLSQGTVDSLAGLGDALLLNQGQRLRNFLGLGGTVNRCSSEYKSGQNIGMFAALIMDPEEEAAGAALGDLTGAEIAQIQSVVDEAGRPLDVVGSAARGARTAESDIDYAVSSSSYDYFNGLEGNLPSIDPGHGLVPGGGNPNIGPYIHFEPGASPTFVPGAE